VLDFGRQRPRVQAERDIDQTRAIDRPGFTTDELISPAPALAGSAAG